MDNNHVVLTIAIAVAGLAVGWVVTYYVLRRLKGKLVLEVDNRAYSPGEVIAGCVQLQCRKPVDCNRFYVALICQEVVHERRRGKSHTHRHEIARQEQDLTGPGLFPAGTTETYEFAVPVPALQDRGGLPSTGSETVDTIMNTVATFASTRRGRLEWALEARVDAKGVDLSDRRSMSINAV